MMDFKINYSEYRGANTKKYLICLQLYVANAGTNITWNNLLRLTQVLYPPRTKVMSDLMLAGFMDCARFLSYYGVTDKALSCLTVESHLHKSQKQVNEVRSKN